MDGHAVEFTFRNLGAPDLARRELTAASAPLAVLLTDIEADLAISDHGTTVRREDRFPVAELARALALWLRLPDSERGNFTFDSMSYDVPGAVRITATAGGWRVGSNFAADSWSSPTAWPNLVANLAAFVETEREQVTALGIGPELIPRL